MTNRTLSLVGMIVTMMAAACSSGEVASAEDPDGGAGASAGSDAATTGKPDGGAAGGVAAACNGDEGGAVPTQRDELQLWLGKRSYECWAHESARHPSTGPHGGEVRTFLNAKLHASMQGTAEHPEGAVAVKELYGGGSTVKGWAVMVKNQAASAKGQGFYWYESFGTEASASGNAIEGQGKALCVDCHAGGKDHVLAPFPLQ